MLLQGKTSSPRYIAVSAPRQQDYCESRSTAAQGFGQDCYCCYHPDRRKTAHVSGAGSYLPPPLMSLSLTCLLHRRHQHHLRVRPRHPACDFLSPRPRRRLGSAKQPTSTNVDDDVMQWQRCDCYATERSTHGRRSCKHTCKDCEDYFGNIALAYPVKRDASDDSPAAK